MLLLLTSIDQYGQIRQFSCPPSSLDAAFDILNAIVAGGHILTKVAIQDDDGLTLLPVEAFDGAPFLVTMQELEKQWQAVLNQPSQQDAIDQERLQRFQNQVDHYQNRIADCKRILNHFQRLTQQADDFASFREKDSRVTRVNNHYAIMIRKYEVNLIKAYLLHETALARLSQIDH